MIEVHFDRGVFLPSCDLWLDPRGGRPLAFVSHAHSDHAGLHARTILTEATARLMKARMGSAGNVHHLLRYGEGRDFGSFRATLLPAGHVLGSAQILVEQGGESLLYTGDFKLRRGLSCEPASTVRASTLVMETTYGLPHYRFPDPAETVARILAFCSETLAEGMVPVLLGYSLGKSQEILSALSGEGLPVMLHGAVWRMTRLYEEMGVSFPAYARYQPESAHGHVLLCPPASSGSSMLENLPPHRVAVITGWAIDAGIRHRYRCDEAFPLSDHADYDELMEMVRLVQPERVLTLHGFAEEFARDLRDLGIEAWSLTGGRQLELSIPLPSVPLVRGPDPAQRGAGGAGAPGETRAVPGSFTRFASACSEVSAEPSVAGKVSMLSAFLGGLESEELLACVRWLSGRLGAPGEEKRSGVGSVLLRKALVLASGLNEGRYRALSRRHRDLSKVAFEALDSPGSTLPVRPMTITSVNALITDLCHSGGPEAKIARLSSWMRSAGASEVSCLVKVLTGEFRTGFSSGLLMDAIAAAFSRDGESVRGAFLITGDAGQAALLASTGRLDEAEPTAFRPLRSMLASPLADESEAVSRLPSPWWAEVKMDGIRAQLHVAGGRAELYSRDLKRITDAFPELREEALSAPIPGPSILDGEILGWDRNADRPLPFSDLQKRLGRDQGLTGDLFLPGGGSPCGIGVRFVPFDLLLLGGSSLLAHPLADRRGFLEEMGLPESLSPFPVVRPEGVRELSSAFLSSRREGHEGLILKDPFSRYSPGRRGLSWFKFKKALATLDVVVTAVEYGHGKRAGVLSDYTFSVRRGGDDPATSGDLLVLGKAYTGLTDVEIAELTDVFLSLSLETSRKKIPVRPEIVIEVAFDSIRESPRHSSGLALRFPRIRSIRRDKAVDEIDTLGTARALLGSFPPGRGEETHPSLS